MKNPYVDNCENLESGNTIFVRHPYKLFLLLEPKSSSSSYLVQLSYKKDLDLTKTTNFNKCTRRKNVLDWTEADKLTGSTVGGKYGFGYATDEANHKNKMGE